jgi:16S rRNA (cytosine1402-N4)-methyltransferase
MNENLKPEDIHQPVLFDAICDVLAGPDKTSIADLTLGMAGHSFGFLSKSPNATLLGIDRDPEALKLAKTRLAPFEDRVRYACAPFENLSQCRKLGSQAQTFDSILADLGVSSLQLDDPERGFSFRFDAPLDMRMGPDAKQSAADIVNTADEQTLLKILRDYGEEAAAWKIAPAIIKARRLGPISTTTELANLIRQYARRPRLKNKKGKGKGIDPATRSFQGLRIAVNDELGSLERTLPQCLDALNPGGHLAIISFHSLEDRIVKQQFKEWAKMDLGRALTKQPRTADPAEIAANRRARSARLRIFQRAL